MLRLQNHLLRFLRVVPTLPSPIHPGARLLSTSTAPAPFSLEDYLVATCGLAPAEARTASKQAFCEASKRAGKPFEELSYSRLNSASNPDAVLALLSGLGLSRADIAAVVVADPLILRSRVEKIRPRLIALRDRVGLSTPEIVRFLLVGSRVLRHANITACVELLISVCGSFEKLLVVLKRNPTLLRVNLERVMEPNIVLLQQCGLSARDIAQMCSHAPRLLSYSPERVKEFLLRAEELGVPRSSRMFWQAVSVVACKTKEKVAARLEFLKSTLGCYNNESEVATAVSKMPSILRMSEECLHSKIQFLVTEVGLEPQFILRRPALIGYSLEKRLVPRHRVIKVLQSKGLLNSNINFYSFASLGEETFKLRYVDCHKDSVPGLLDAYATARTGVVPSGV